MDLVSLLLTKSPANRLGTALLSHSPYEFAMHGAFYVKEHSFFTNPIDVSSVFALVLVVCGVLIFGIIVILLFYCYFLFFVLS
jgi:hypothetical protein